MSKSLYKSVVLNVTHPDGREKDVRAVYLKLRELVDFLDRHFDKGYKVKKGRRSPEMSTVYLNKKQDKSLYCSTNG